MKDAWNDYGEAKARIRRALRSGDAARVTRAIRSGRRVARDEGVSRRRFMDDVRSLKETVGATPELAADETTTKEEGNRGHAW